MVREELTKFEAGQPCAEEADIGKMLAAAASWAAEARVQTRGGFGLAK